MSTMLYSECKHDYMIVEFHGKSFNIWTERQGTLIYFIYDICIHVILLRHNSSRGMGMGHKYINYPSNVPILHCKLNPQEFIIQVHSTLW